MRRDPTQSPSDSEEGRSDAPPEKILDLPSQETEDCPQNDTKRAETISALVKLLKAMDPFLGCEGLPFCRAPTSAGGLQGILPIRDRRVHSLLFYLYHQQYGNYARQERIHEAVEYVAGKLLAHRRGPFTTPANPVLRCFFLATQEEGEGAGSAEEILKLLRATIKEHRQELVGVALPKSPGAMGKWLVKHQLLLQHHNIELTRLRNAKKRLWAWSTIRRDDDANDTSTVEVSFGASLPNSGQNNENGPNDALTEDEARILKEAQS